MRWEGCGGRGERTVLMGGGVCVSWGSVSNIDKFCSKDPSGKQDSQRPRHVGEDRKWEGWRGKVRNKRRGRDTWSHSPLPHEVGASFFYSRNRSASCPLEIGVFARGGCLPKGLSSSGEGRGALGRTTNIQDSKGWKERISNLCTIKAINVTAGPKEEKLCRNCSLIHLLANLSQAHSSMDPH